VVAALLIVGGYLLGSMPFGYWVVRVAKGEDVRSFGSGSIGASNVWRTYGKGYGVPIVLLDIGKGFAPALAGTLLEGELVGVLAGGAAMLGHWRPLFLGFQKGG
jgi:glycerol-3-phosphate acyltransferase PlsY